MPSGALNPRDKPYPPPKGLLDREYARSVSVGDISFLEIFSSFVQLTNSFYADSFVTAVLKFQWNCLGRALVRIRFAIASLLGFGGISQRALGWTWAHPIGRLPKRAGAASRPSSCE